VGAVDKQGNLLLPALGCDLRDREHHAAARGDVIDHDQPGPVADPGQDRRGDSPPLVAGSGTGAIRRPAPAASAARRS
jgi:hypothetical protein